MMLHFLRADIPLTKTFRQTEDGLEKTSYPFVKNFSSIDHPVDTIHEFADALRFHASENHCLLKGKLSRVLRHESRAGTTDSLDPTEWIVFDVDGLPGIQTPEEFVALLPQPFRESSYVVQLSASYGFDGQGGLRAHIFFLLNEPRLPSALKLWLQNYNFEEETLYNATELSANAVTLKYPLDITVAQNDKLIYIASPVCEGVEDPHHGQRIRVVEGKHERVQFNFPVDVAFIHQRERQRVTELRRERGLNPKKANIKFTATGEAYISNPDVAAVTGEKEMNGFMRLNLNAGDSWGYYYNPDRPKYLRNFKGEPMTIMADFLPAYWRVLQERWRANQDDNVEVCLIFNDPAADQLYKGTYDPVNNRHQIYMVGAVNKLQWWADLHGTPMPDPVEDWTVEFRPDLDTVIDQQRRLINLYQPTELWKMTTTEPAEIPFQCKRIIDSICVDEETKDHFLNWIATVVQTRMKTGTAWVFQGVQGTGKGLLINHIIAPILGEDYVVTKQLSHFEDQFNLDMEKAIILCVDESSLENTRQAHKIANLFKQFITDDKVTIRGMRQNARHVRTFCNLVITSNDYDPMIVEDTDRRYNIAPRQESPLDFDRDDLEMLHAELAQFAQFLKAYDIDTERAQAALSNVAKEEMRVASRNNVDELVYRMRDGDLEWIVGELEEGCIGDNHVTYAVACDRAQKWCDDAIQGKSTNFAILAFSELYHYLSGNTPNRGRLKKMLQKKHINTRERIVWQTDPFKAQNLKKRLMEGRKGELAL